MGAFFIFIFCFFFLVKMPLSWCGVVQNAGKRGGQHVL